MRRRWLLMVALVLAIFVSLPVLVRAWYVNRQHQQQQDQDAAIAFLRRDPSKDHLDRLRLPSKFTSLSCDGYVYLVGTPQDGFKAFFPSDIDSDYAEGTLFSDAPLTKDAWIEPKLGHQFSEGLSNWGTGPVRPHWYEVSSFGS